MQLDNHQAFKDWVAKEIYLSRRDGEPVPEVNMPLLRKVVDWALDEAKKPVDERQWDQNWWIRKADCGTACCLAGFAVQVQGYQVWWESPYESTSSDVIVTEGGVGIGEFTDDGTEVMTESIPNVARNELGLLRVEADCLFDGSNTAVALRRYAEWIAERAGERL